MIDSDKCVGCRYCLLACPYQQRSYFDGKVIQQILDFIDGRRSRLSVKERTLNY